LIANHLRCNISRNKVATTRNIYVQVCVMEVARQAPSRLSAASPPSFSFNRLVHASNSSNITHIMHASTRMTHFHAFWQVPAFLLILPNPTPRRGAMQRQEPGVSHAGNTSDNNPSRAATADCPPPPAMEP
jgi:hypothetical protein